MALAETARMLAQADYKDNITAGVNKSIKSVDKLESRFKKIGAHASRGIGNAAKNLERFAAIGVGAAAGALVYSVKAAIDWESAVAGINKTIEATPAELKAITDGIIAMSNRMPVAANELAAIAESAGALGIAKQDVLAFTETVALIGTTTNVSTEMAATALGQLSNVLRLTGQDYDNFASTLVDLGNKGASTESQILEITRRSGAAANLIGLAKDATLGWASAAANLGINQELAGSSLQRFYLQAMPLFTQGSKLLQKITGDTAKELKTAFQQDAGGALESFLKDLGKMPQDARLKAVQKLFGTGSGLTRLILGLSSSIDQNLTPSLDTAAEAWETNTAAAAEAEKRYATTESQLAVLKNNLTNVAVTIGSNLLPVINELAKVGVAWITEHQSDIKRFGQDLAKGIREAVTWAKQLDWDAIVAALGTAASFAKGLVQAFLGMPAWVQTAVVTGWGLNKLTGGAVAGIVGELAKGLVKGVLGITAGVVNINAAAVRGGGMPGVPATGGAAGAATAGLAGALALVSVGIAAGVAQAIALEGINVGLKDTEGFKDLQFDAGIFAPLTNLPKSIDFLSRVLQGNKPPKPPDPKVIADRIDAAQKDNITHLNKVVSGESDIEAATKRASATNIAHINRVVAGTNAVKGATQATRASVLATKSAISAGASSTARNLDQVESAVRNKKLSVKVDQAQRQTVTAIANSSGAKAAGGADDIIRRTTSQRQNYNLFRAKGAVGLATQATPAIFGEAGPEAFAILRNPRAGTIGGGGVPIVNVTVNIDPRRITRKQTSSGVYKTYVAT